MKAYLAQLAKDVKKPNHFKQEYLPLDAFAVDFEGLMVNLVGTCGLITAMSSLLAVPTSAQSILSRMFIWRRVQAGKSKKSQYLYPVSLQHDFPLTIDRRVHTFAEWFPLMKKSTRDAIPKLLLFWELIRMYCEFDIRGRHEEHESNEVRKLHIGRLINLVYDNDFSECGMRHSDTVFTNSFETMQLLLLFTGLGDASSLIAPAFRTRIKTSDYVTQHGRASKLKEFAVTYRMIALNVRMLRAGAKVGHIVSLYNAPDGSWMIADDQRVFERTRALRASYGNRVILDRKEAMQVKRSSTLSQTFVDRLLEMYDNLTSNDVFIDSSVQYSLTLGKAAVVKRTSSKWTSLESPFLTALLQWPQPVIRTIVNALVEKSLSSGTRSRVTLDAADHGIANFAAVFRLMWTHGEHLPEIFGAVGLSPSPRPT